MNDRQKLFSDTPHVKRVVPETPTPETVEEVEDLGACAAIAKDKWVSALTIKTASGEWPSFQYRGIATRSGYTPSTSFWVRFVDEDATWQVTVTGRNLERIYALVIQARMEWLRAADRDFATDGKPFISKIEVTKVEEPKAKD